MFSDDDASRLTPEWVPRLRRQLAHLDAAAAPEDMDTVDFAKRLSAALGGSAESWLTMQLHYDLALSPDVKVKRIAA